MLTRSTLYRHAGRNRIYVFRLFELTQMGHSSWKLLLQVFYQTPVIHADHPMANRMFLGVLTFKHSHSRRIRFFNSQSGNMILEFIPWKCPSENAGVIVIDINVGKCYSFSSDRGSDLMESGMDVFRRVLFLAKFIAAWWSTASGVGNKPSSDMPCAPRHLLSASRHVLRFCRRLCMNGLLLALRSSIQYATFVFHQPTCR